MVPNLEIESSVAEASDTVPVQETKTKKEKLKKGSWFRICITIYNRDRSNSVIDSIIDK